MYLPLSPHRAAPTTAPRSSLTAPFQLNEVSQTACSEMAEPRLDAGDLVRKWAQVSLVADHNEQPAQVDRLAEALKVFLRTGADKLVVGAKGAPYLVFLLQRWDSPHCPPEGGDPMSRRE